MNRFQKILIVFLSFLTISFSALSYYAVPSVKAQTTNPWYSQSFAQWYVKVYDRQTSPPEEIFGERYTAAQVQWIIYSLVSLFPQMASDVVSCVLKGGDATSCLSENPLTSSADLSKPFEQKSVFATLFPGDRHPSGVNYARSKLTQLHLVPQADAQATGFGFSALNPIQNIWRVCRDIMYGFFVLVIIIFAFMIMFRVKLNPQTVVSVQSSIPKIIITLIMVTFSYAIAGLLIDLMYVLIGIVALIFDLFNIFQNTTNEWGHIFELLTVGPEVLGTGGIIAWLAGFWWAFASAFFGFVGTIFLGGTSGTTAATIGESSLAGIVGVFLTIGVAFWLIIVSVKVFILLIKTYLTIFVSIIFSPFIIGFGAILPTGGFGGWFKGLATSLLVYPLAGAILLISVLFLSSTSPGVRTYIVEWLGMPTTTTVVDIFDPTQNSQFWYPPMTLGSQTGSWDPLPILWTFASLGVLGMLPKLADIIKGVMSGKGAEFGIGAAIGAAGGYAAGAGKKFAGLTGDLIKYPISRNIQALESGRENAARQGGKEGYVPLKRTVFLRKIGVIK